MLKKMLGAAAALLLLSGAGASARQAEPGLGAQFLYGYASAGDDPARYTAEVEAGGVPTNVASLAVLAPAEDITAKVRALNARGQRAAVVLDLLLFKQLSLPTPCGDESMRPWLNYRDRFAVWLDVNRGVLDAGRVAFVVINTEVNNRCLDPSALDEVTRHVKSLLPGVAAVAGYGRSDGAKPVPVPVPPALDGVLFYRYYVYDPNADADYQREYDGMVSKLAAGQRVILVPDGFYGTTHSAAGWPKWYIGYLALNHARFALARPRIVGVLYLQWPDFTDKKTGQVTWLGTRSLPQNVRDRHREAGCLLGVTNPFVPACD